MAHCQNCAHESPPGSQFCLNCGTRLHSGQSGHSGSTPAPGAALPGNRVCPACRTENPPGMNFCRNCGGGLAVPAPVAMAPSAPAPSPIPTAAVPPSPSAANAPPQACPHCGGQTPRGFGFCQQCGSKIEAPKQSSPALASGTSGEAVAPTLAAPAAAYGARSPQASQSAWGVLISVNRDGTDGDRYPLQGDWATVGRRDADVCFAEDRFLAKQHARFLKTDQSISVLPLDQLNGVFRRLSAPYQLEDGDVVLVGREVLQFEQVVEDERITAPLVKHGVAIFGSPPREPWGCLSQRIPNGGIRDVRFLYNEEITIGREDGDLVFRDDAFLSRVHATLRWQNGKCTFEDLKSSNGSFVRLRGQSPVKTGDHLRLGDQLFRFEQSV